jgi:hypothetical protein
VENRTVLNVLNRLYRAVNGVASSYLGVKGYGYFTGYTRMLEEQDLKKVRAIINSGQLPRTTDTIDLLRRLIDIYNNISGSYTPEYGPSSEWEYAVEDAGNLISNMSVLKESKMASRRLNLAKLPNKTITLVFDSNALAKTFGLPELEPDLDFDSGWYPSDSDVADTSDLDISQYDHDDEEEGDLSSRDSDYVDANGTPIPEAVMDDLKMALSEGLRSGTEARVYEANRDALENALMTFSDYQYEYDAMDDRSDNYVGMSGLAKGVQSVDIKYDTTTVVANIDIVNVINDCINGVGEFYATTDLEGDTPEDFAKTRFHWLKYYWKIYGEARPDASDVQEDFDNAYFSERVQEIEQESGLTLLNRWARQRYLGKK